MSESKDTLTPAFIDEQVELVLRAAGSSLRHYMPASREDLRNAMRQAMIAARELAVADLVWALQAILANTEEDAIPHISHDGLTAYQSLARDISDCASAALSRFSELERAALLARALGSAT